MPQLKMRHLLFLRIGGGVTHIMWCGLLWFMTEPIDGLFYIHVVMKFWVPSETGISRSASLCSSTRTRLHGVRNFIYAAVFLRKSRSLY